MVIKKNEFILFLLTWRDVYDILNDKSKLQYECFFLKKQNIFVCICMKVRKVLDTKPSVNNTSYFRGRNGGALLGDEPCTFIELFKCYN